MRVLLTGASGFLGSHIAESLVEKGYSVRCFVRPTSDVRFLSTLRGIELYSGNFRDKQSLIEAVKNIDAIIHNAGLTNGYQLENLYATNVDNTKLLLSAAEQETSLKRFIYVSSLAASGPTKINESNYAETLAGPVSHYGRSKLMGEKLALQFKNKMPVTIIRPPIIYGPRDKNFLLFFKALQKGVGLLPLNGETRLSIIHAQDAATSIVNSLDYSGLSGSTFFIDDGKVYSFRDLIHELALIVRKKNYLKLPLPYFLLKGISFCKPSLLSDDKLREMTHLNWTCNSHNTREELVWTPQYDWQSGAAMTYAWYKKAGWIG